MLTIERCRKTLADKAVGLSDEQIEAVRDELYIAANLSFEHWHKSRSSTKAEETSSSPVGEQPRLPELRAGDSADEK
jgi:hypothetical protein